MRVRSCRQRLASYIVAPLAASVVFGATSAAATGSPAAADPLKGSWETRAVPVSLVRTALLRAHYTDADVTTFLTAFHFTKSKNLRFAVKFYREPSGEPFVLQRFFDASKPTPDGDHGPYKLMPNHRFSVTSADPSVNKYRYVFSYQRSGIQLKLHFVSGTNPGLSAKDLRFDKVVQTAFTASSYTRR